MVGRHQGDSLPPALPQRTSQTAALAFSGLSASAPWLRRDCRESLYRDILHVKEPGANLILVTHSTGVGEFHDRGGKPLRHIGFHDSRSYGLAAFVAVDQRQGALYPIGVLRLDEWPAARARLKP